MLKVPPQIQIPVSELELYWKWSLIYVICDSFYIFRIGFMLLGIKIFYLFSCSLFRMNFLSNILREEGGFDYKKAIVDSIVILIRDIPDAKESGLLHLCEFIEDCEFTYLSTQVDFSIPVDVFLGFSLLFIVNV